MPAAGSSPQARGTRQFIQRLRRRQRFIPAGAGNTASGNQIGNQRSVHPRRRGEHRRGVLGRRGAAGSSPQARGTPASSRAKKVFPRFIPAGAGNTHRSDSERIRLSVHPRRRGEHTLEPYPVHQRDGSSPQARGTPPPGCRRQPPTRFIPAGAGNTPSRLPLCVTGPVHPRRRGEHFCAGQPRRGRCGSSPQARGTPDCRLPAVTYRRFIPAGAGNTRNLWPAYRCTSVHPRRRGEHPNGDSTHISTSGSSPQARGTPPEGHRTCSRRRFIPAGAGNTRRPYETTRSETVHPRRRGEHIRVRRAFSHCNGSSPQARGTRGVGIYPDWHPRFIPAGAGNTGHRNAGFCPAAVHPRRRGEHGVQFLDRGTKYGSSPQARGTRRSVSGPWD